MKPAMFLILMVAVGCSQRAEPRKVACVEGASRACACPSGASGAQVCASDGAFDECICEGEGDADLPDSGAAPDADDAPDMTVDASGATLHFGGSCIGSDDCTIALDSGDAAHVEFVVTRDGAPLSGALLEFALDAAAQGTTLDRGSALTGADGSAAVEVRAGASSTVTEVVALLPGTAESRSATIVVSSPGTTSLRVSFSPFEAGRLGDVDVLLFESLACATILADLALRSDDDSGTAPSLTATRSVSVTTAGDGAIPDAVFPGLSSVFSGAVLALAQTAGEPRVERAQGCADGLGPGSVPTLALVEHEPAWARTFDSEESYLRTQPLPAPIEELIGLASLLNTSPGEFWVGAQGSASALELLHPHLPDGSFKDSVESFVNNAFIQNLAADVVDNFALDWSNNNAPAWTRNAVNLPGDVSAALSAWQVVGELRVGQAPAAHVWDSVAVEFTGACDRNSPNFATCVRRTVPATVLAVGAPVGGTPAPALINGNLAIPQYALNLNLVRANVAIFEQAILPVIFGDATVTTISAAVDRVVRGVFGGSNGCDGFGDWLNDTVGGGGSIGESVCNGLVAQASAYIRAVALELGGGMETFRITLPQAAACSALEPTPYPANWSGQPLPWVERFASGTVPCDLTVEPNLGTPLPVAGNWYLR